MLNIAESGELSALADPFLLNPEGTLPADRRAHADVLTPRLDEDFGAWTAPFVMAAINTRVVRRSAALTHAFARASARGAKARDVPYGEDFLYQETLHTGRGARGAALATGMTVGLGAGAVAMRVSVLRGAARALASKVMPAPGQGPSQRAMDGGSFRCELIGRDEAGHEVRGRMAGQGDPGNRATTVFVCEAAMALAGDLRRLPGGAARGGVLTPATALGLPYAHRLVAAGITVEPLEPA
jgi:short subunit dehydrogenase-like uncharacterized protein